MDTREIEQKARRAGVKLRRLSAVHLRLCGAGRCVDFWTPANGQTKYLITGRKGRAKLGTVDDAILAAVGKRPERRKAKAPRKRKAKGAHARLNQAAELLREFAELYRKGALRTEFTYQAMQLREAVEDAERWLADAQPINAEDLAGGDGSEGVNA